MPSLGVVTTWSPARRCGYIHDEVSNRVVYVSKKEISLSGIDFLRQGDLIEFDIIYNAKKQRFEARNLFPEFICPTEYSSRLQHVRKTNLDSKKVGFSSALKKLAGKFFCLNPVCSTF